MAQDDDDLLYVAELFCSEISDLSNNPLNFDINKYYTESTSKLLTVLLDSMNCEYNGFHFVTDESESCVTEKGHVVYWFMFHLSSLILHCCL